MTIHSRPISIRRPIATFADLQQWLDERLAGVNEDLADDETAQAMGSRLRERRATLLDIVHAIREAVACEGVVDGQESAEAAWRERYPDADELTLRRLGGDR